MSKGAWTLLGFIIGMAILAMPIFLFKDKAISFIARSNNISEEEARDRHRLAGRATIACFLWFLVISAAAIFLKSMWPVFCGLTIALLLCIVEIVRFLRNKKPLFFK